MVTRAQAATLASRSPSRLKSAVGLQPAGTYRVEAEELLGGLFFPACRHVSIATTTRRTAGAGALVRALLADPAGIGRGACGGPPLKRRSPGPPTIGTDRRAALGAPAVSSKGQQDKETRA